MWNPLELWDKKVLVYSCIWVSVPIKCLSAEVMWQLYLQHRVSSILMCDKVVVLHSGKVIEADTPYNLRMRESVFASMVNQVDWPIHMTSTFKVPWCLQVSLKLKSSSWVSFLFLLSGSFCKNISSIYYKFCIHCVSC